MVQATVLQAIVVQATVVQATPKCKFITIEV